MVVEHNYNDIDAIRFFDLIVRPIVHELHNY